MHRGILEREALVVLLFFLLPTFSNIRNSVVDAIRTILRHSV